MIANDYVIVQIDTDQCHQARFDVPKTVDNEPFDLDDFVERVRTRLIAEMDDDLYAHDGQRVLFAICVHSLECWLLPIYEQRTRQARSLNNCLFRLNKQLARQNKPTLGKTPSEYDIASDIFLKRKNLLAIAPKNPSLQLFVEWLEMIDVDDE